MNELPSTAIGTLRLFATTQTQVDVFSDQIIESVKHGEANPLEVLTMFKAFEKVSERVLNEIKPNILTEAEKHPERIFEFNGNKIEKAELGVKYNYSICNDPVYNELKMKLDEAAKLVKEREEFLKALKEPITQLNEDTGEIFKIIPPLKTSQSGVKISIR